MDRSAFCLFAAALLILHAERVTSGYCDKKVCRDTKVKYETRVCCDWVIVCVRHCMESKERIERRCSTKRVCCEGWTGPDCNTPVCYPHCKQTEECYGVNRCRCDPTKHPTQCKQPTQQPPTVLEKKGEKKKLSDGAIAGIALAVLMFVLLLVVLLVMGISYWKSHELIPRIVREKTSNFYSNVSQRLTRNTTRSDKPTATDTGGKPTANCMKVSYARDDDYSYFYDGNIDNVPSAKWEPSNDRVTITEALPDVQGHFADIKLAQLKQGKGTRQVVVKMNKARETEQFLTAKLNFLAKAVPGHALIVELIGAVFPGPLIVLEYCNSGTLLAWLQAVTKLTGDIEQQMIMFALQVAVAMEFLHGKGILHRRLGARNVLLHRDPKTTQMLAKLSGFGPLKVFKKEKGPIKWMAPEQLKNSGARKQIYNKQTDIWSYGVLVCEIFSKGEKPYKNLSQSEVIKSVTSGHRMNKPTDCPQFIYDEIVTSCWSSVPDKRASFSEIVCKLNGQYGNHGAGEVYGYGTGYGEKYACSTYEMEAGGYIYDKALQ